MLGWRIWQTVKVGCTVLGVDITKTGYQEEQSCQGNIQPGEWTEVGLGGIVGTNGFEAVVQNCYNAGSLASEAEGRYLGGIAGKAEGIVANSYCSVEFAEMNFGSMDGIPRECKAWPADEMQTNVFLGQLNANRGDNEQWLEWEIRTGEGNSCPLPVKRVNLNQCQINLADAEQVYDGTEKKPPIYITYDGKTLADGKDYSLVYRNNINVGTASVEMEGLGRYMDSASCTFEIVCANLAQCTIMLSENSFVYDGKTKEPSVTVELGGKTLSLGTDYTVAYSNNTEAGTARISITGKGGYTGAAETTFTINKAAQSIHCTKSYTKAYGSKPFALDVKREAGDGRLSYTSSNQKVAAVKNGKVTLAGTGIVTITIEAAETANYSKTSVTASITVKPAKQSVSSLKAVRGRKLAVSWKKDGKATGYRIQYSTDKKFKKGVKTVSVTKNKTIKKTIPKLSAGKRYYVRVRSYKSVKADGKNQKLYGAWSSAKRSKSIKK